MLKTIDYVSLKFWIFAKIPARWFFLIFLFVCTVYYRSVILDGQKNHKINNSSAIWELNEPAKNWVSIKNITNDIITLHYDNKS